MAVLVLFGVWAALGAIWEEWPAFGLGAFCFVVVALGTVSRIESQRTAAMRVLVVLVLVVLLSLVETAIQKIAVGALDGSSRKVVIGFAWLAVPALFAGYFARIGWFTLIPKLFRRRR